MMRLLWTLASVGLGIGLATVEVGERTPWQHAQASFRTYATAETWESLKTRMAGALGGLKAAWEGDPGPRERHSARERAALNRLIARRAAPLR